MDLGSVLFTVLYGLLGLFVLYLVIYMAVKDAINKSVIGQFIDKNDGTNQKSFLDGDLDNEDSVFATGKVTARQQQEASLVSMTGTVSA